MTSSMLVSLVAMSDCRLHWAGPLSILVIAVSFCGLQLGAGALVSHLDLTSTHSAVIVALTGTVGACSYFVLPAFTRILSATQQVWHLVCRGCKFSLNLLYPEIFLKFTISGNFPEILAITWKL